MADVKQGYCVECTKRLDPAGPHEDFCSQGCQKVWMAKDSDPLWKPATVIDYGGPSWYVRD